MIGVIVLRFRIHTSATYDILLLSSHNIPLVLENVPGASDFTAHLSASPMAGYLTMSRNQRLVVLATGIRASP